ncbi:MAG: hypothetical protein C0599_03075 [Salinivirgaceae bacterium]|nr:MAG: hypothetical protein C0599_03075 [Salinivirgaceae bacterium]
MAWDDIAWWWGCFDNRILFQHQVIRDRLAGLRRSLVDICRCILHWGKWFLGSPVFVLQQHYPVDGFAQLKSRNMKI